LLLKATPCVEVWQTSNLRRLRVGEEKKIEETTGLWPSCVLRSGRPATQDGHNQPQSLQTLSMLEYQKIAWNTR